MEKSQAKIDEFAFILLAGLLFIIILTVAWSSLPKPTLEVSPEFISLVAVRGSTAKATLFLNGSASNVTLKAKGDIANWVKFSKNQFPLAQATEITLTFYIPYSVEFGTYSGNIEIEFDGERKAIPVTLDVVEREAEAYRSFKLGDFSVSYFSGREILASKSDFEVVKGYFADYPSTLVASVDEEMLSILKSGFISLAIEEANSAGNLAIKFNDEIVFNEKTGAGEIKIPIEKEKIKSSNVIKLEAGLPGWKFWMNTVYKIKSLEFGINYEGINFKQSTFSLKQEEIDNFKWGKVIFQLKNRTGEGNLIIKINGEEVYRGVPEVSVGGLFGVYFSEIPLNKTNEILFSTEKASTYELGRVTLTIAYSSY